MGIMGIVDSRACASAVSDTEGRTVTDMTDYIDTALRIFTCLCSAFLYLVVTLVVNVVAGIIFGDCDDMFPAWFTGMILFSSAMIVAVTGVTV